MQIVIDIPEETYEWISRSGFVAEEDSQEIGEAIHQGIPLPKGHGRLIDADELKTHKYYDGRAHEKAVAVAFIDWAETIIEADKEEE